MKAIVVSVGDELISGQVVDTNSAWLSGELGRLGVQTVAHRTVGDSREAIAEAISSAAAQADIVIVSGGLGPTEDDLTRQALADAMASPLALDERCLAQIEEFFRRRGRAMAEANRLQAMIPRGAEAMENKVGTAPGIAATIGRARVFVVPGVPSEMRWMFQAHVAARLAGTGITILHHVIHTFGAGESDVGAKIADLMRARSADTTVGTTVAAGMVSIRITSRGNGQGLVERRIQQAAAEIKARLGRLVVGEGDATMASAVGELLGRRRQTLATAESCTGGMVGEMITSVSGSSEYYLGGVVAYANRLKQQELDVPAELLERHGAVSEPVAAAMAEGCRKRFASDWAVSVTGIAGPTGGTEEKPVGLVYVGLAGPGPTRTWRHLFPGDRQTVRLRSALAALNSLRLELLERGGR